MAFIATVYATPVVVGRWLPGNAWARMQISPPSSGGSLHKQRIGNVPDPSLRPMMGEGEQES